MKVTGLAICPPPAAEGNPRVTPELLASCLARYSRSNQGLEAILSGIDWNDPDRSVDSIFRFVDYGHASIAGMTGGIALAVDGCSMLLAYKIFELAQLCDGQESSTRYIKMDEESLPEPMELGIPEALAEGWQGYMKRSFEIYRLLYKQLNDEAEKNPAIVRVPDGAPDKVVKRLRKNYALDRVRYLIPFATRTNAAYVMTARVWAEVIRQLDSLPWVEARSFASLARVELEKFTPRLVKHSCRDEAAVAQARQDLELSRQQILRVGVPTECCVDQVSVRIDRTFPDFLGQLQDVLAAFEGKQSRYSTCGQAIRRILVRCAWNNISIAELRDLNRHRSGCRFTPLSPVGFYLPHEIDRKDISMHLEEGADLIRELALVEPVSGCHLYGYLLGVQVPFEHSTHLDKFIYEIELRTGMGAHFRYAEHLHMAASQLIKEMPELAPFINLGTAEPE